MPFVEEDPLEKMPQQAGARRMVLDMSAATGRVHDHVDLLLVATGFIAGILLETAASILCSFSTIHEAVSLLLLFL